MLYSATAVVPTLGVFASAFLLTSKGLSYFKREALGGIMLGGESKQRPTMSCLVPGLLWKREQMARWDTPL